MADLLSSNPGDLARAMAEQNRAMEEQEAARQAGRLNLPYLNLQNFPLDLNALALITEEEALASESVPFFRERHELRVGTINPNNQLLKAKLEQFKQKDKVDLYFISKSSFQTTLSFFKKVVHPSSNFTEVITVESKADYTNDLNDLKTAQAGVPATKELAALFGSAVQQGSSDIHLEPEEKIVKARFRVDGVLHESAQIAKAAYTPLLARLKLQAKMKLNVVTEPQDGRITISVDGKPLDVRVSILPSAYGEAVVMRLLGVGAVSLEVKDLGLIGKSAQIIEQQLQKPNGMILTTGPTGSGKTTTLYAFIKTLNEPGVKIITLEDPVEYKIEGIQQTPIDHNADFNFASALRSVLRQDPDIVMVGEIRDAETAETALQAALTGHVVLSTLHTNDAAGAVPRLVTMGVKPFIIAPAVNAIIAQRLVRRLCKACIEPYTPDEVVMEKVRHIVSEIPEKAGVKIPKDLQFYHSKGCKECSNMGYKGRIGVYEVIEITDNMRDLIMKEASGIGIKQEAIKNGTMTMIQDGVVKALDKITDLDEIFRVVG